MINAIGMAVVSTYLLVVVGNAVKRNDSSVFSLVGNLIRFGITKIDHSLQDYIEEKDEEMLGKIKQVKKDPTRKEVTPIEDSNKYEIFM